MTIRRTRSTCVVFVGVTLASLLAGCSDADESASEPKPERASVADKPRTATIDGTACLIEADAVADATGSAVVDQGITGGSSGDLEATITWSGCTFETEDGTTYRVAELVGDDGRPDATGFADLLAAADAAPRPPDIGDDAFFSDDALYVVVDDETFVFEIYGATLEEGDTARLEALAERIIAIEGPGAGPRCDALAATVPTEWEPGTTVSRGGGTRGEVEYELCGIDLGIGAGATLEVEVVPGRTVFEEEQTNRGIDAVVRVEDVGDAALTLDDRLLVLVGDRAFMISRETDDTTDDGNGGAVESLARAVVAQQG